MPRRRNRAAELFGDRRIEGSSLESSNVDIATQFSQLIVAQQAYSANARVMTTANQMIQSSAHGHPVMMRSLLSLSGKPRERPQPWALIRRCPPHWRASSITQQAISVIAGNIANANTPGYVDETVNQVELGTAGTTGTQRRTATASIAISIRCCRVSCGPRRRAVPTPTRTRSSISSFKTVYGTPGRRHRSTRSSIISRPRCNRLSTNPSAYSNQAAVISAAQALAQNLNSMTTSVQQLRTQAEAGIANDVQTANGLLQNHRGDQRQARRHRLQSRHHRGDARGSARPGHHAAFAADECSRACRARTIKSRYLPAPGCSSSAGYKPRKCRSTMRARCRRRRCGARIRARTAPARLR